MLFKAFARSSADIARRTNFQRNVAHFQRSQQGWVFNGANAMAYALRADPNGLPDTSRSSSFARVASEP